MRYPDMTREFEIAGVIVGTPRARLVEISVRLYCLVSDIDARPIRANEIELRDRLTAEIGEEYDVACSCWRPLGAL